jgi:hypothetical protein
MGLFSFDGCEISVEPPFYKKLKSGRRKVLLLPKHGGLLEGITVVYRNGVLERSEIPASVTRRDSPGSLPIILELVDRNALPLFLEEKLRKLERETKIATERRRY